jgi:hypothetical protein
MSLGGAADRPGAEPTAEAESGAGGRHDGRALSRREKVLLDCVRYLLADEDPALARELLGWLP